MNKSHPNVPFKELMRTNTLVKVELGFIIVLLTAIAIRPLIFPRFRARNHLS
jgi:hypothetical protein